MFNKNEFRGAVARVGITEKELANRIGMSKNTLSSRVNGKSNFDTDEIDKICIELHIENDSEKVKIFLAKSSHNRDEVEMT